MNQAAETKLAEVRLQYACTMEELTRLKNKTLTDEECLEGFPMPPRKTVKDSERFDVNGSLFDLKERLNLIPESELPAWRLVGREDRWNDYPYLIHYFDREETDREYDERVASMRQGKIKSVREVREKNLRQNIKGLERKARGLESMIKNLEPVMTMDERVDKLLEGYEGTEKETKRLELMKILRMMRLG